MGFAAEIKAEPMLSRFCECPETCTLEPGGTLVGTAGPLTSKLAAAVTARMFSEGRTAAGEGAAMCGAVEMSLSAARMGAAAAELLKLPLMEALRAPCGLKPLGVGPSRLALSLAAALADLALSAPTIPTALSSWLLLELNDEGLRPLDGMPDACTAAAGDAAPAVVAAPAAALAAAAAACARAVDARRTRSTTSMAAAAAGEAAEELAADGDAPDASGDDAGAPEAALAAWTSHIGPVPLCVRGRPPSPAVALPRRLGPEDSGDASVAAADAGPAESRAPNAGNAAATPTLLPPPVLLLQALSATYSARANPNPTPLLRRVGRGGSVEPAALPVDAAAASDSPDPATAAAALALPRLPPPVMWAEPEPASSRPRLPTLPLGMRTLPAAVIAPPPFPLLALPALP